MRVPFLLLVSLVTPDVALASLLEVARERCAARLETGPTLLETVVENTTTLPVTKVTFTAFKFLQPLAIGSCQVSLLPDGTEVSAEELVEAEIAEHWRRYGVLRIWQDKVVRSLEPRRFVIGLLILRRPANTPDFRNAANPSAQKAEFLSTFSASTVNRLVTAFPGGHFTPLPDMFAVRFKMTAADVLSAVRWPEFEALEFDDLEGVLLQAAAPVWFGASRFNVAHPIADGTGGRVGVIESGNVQSNQFVPNLVIRQPGSDAIDAFHTESVVSVISNVFPGVQPGGAPGAQIDFAGNSRLAGNNFDSTRRALALLVTRSQDAYNLSFFEGVRSGALVLPTREPRAIGRLADEAAYDLGLTVVAGAGNIPNPSPAIDFEFVPSPANALNVLAVGMFRDAQTVGWTDDQTSTRSAWRNPVGLFGGRPKPDVIAASDPALVWDSLNSADFKSGTSFAAPMVSSVAALLGSAWRRTGRATTLPNEVVRAIIAASAQHNVDGFTVARQVAGSYPLVPLSEFDGAGAIDASGAVEILEKNRALLVGVTTCPVRGTAGMQVLPGARFSLAAGERARVAFAYSSLPNQFYAPTADFDIVVGEVTSSGQLVRITAWSGFRDNTLEAIEFRADSAATFQAFYLNNTIGTCVPPRYIGYAWWPNVPSGPR